MSYFGNTLSIEVEENCRKLADTFRVGIYDADIFLPQMRAALNSLVDLAAYAGDIKTCEDLATVRKLLGLWPVIPHVVIQDNTKGGKRDAKGRFQRIHSDRSAQPSPSDWLDDDNIDKLKK